MRIGSASCLLGCYFNPPKRAVGPKLFLCALGLATLLASSASAQVLGGRILLPDSLGPLTGKTHVALDEDPNHPRMFIGSEDGDVLVVDARTCERLARIQSGPVASLCYSPKHNKLYTSTVAGYSVVVADCGSYQVIKELHFTEYVNGLFCNPVVDRVYCGSYRMKVIDCAGDSVVGSLMIYGYGICFAFDSSHNRLYVGASDTFRVIDCNRDSVVASISELRGAQAVCLQPTAGKVYVAAGESLFALATESDTVVYRHRFDTLNPQLACDPEHNRVYYTYWGNAIALDCANDSVVWRKYLWARAISLAAVPAQGKLCMILHGLGFSTTYVLDGATGLTLRDLDLGNVLYRCAAVNRTFVVRDERGAWALDCEADTVAGVTQLTSYISSVCVDSVDNKLYFSASFCGVGIVDCATNKVTSYSYACPIPRGLAYAPLNNKMYCSGSTSIFVYDCTADTVVGVIPVGGRAVSMDWHPTLNKLYAVTVTQMNEEDTFKLVIVDCAADTVTTALIMLRRWAEDRATLLDPELNQFWFVHDRGYIVVDCLHDSIVTDTGAPFGCRAASCDPINYRVYAASDDVLYVIDMDTRQPIDSLPIPQTESGTRQVYCATRARKIYWRIQHQSEDSVYAVDIRVCSIVARLALPHFSAAVCDDRTGDYVYFASGNLLVVDARTDSVVSEVDLPLGTSFSARNSKTNRIYLAGLCDSVIQVVCDSVILAGLQAASVSATERSRSQTLLCRGEPLCSGKEGSLFDASGRRAAALRSGANDISWLAPGVYFLREGPQAAYLRPQAARKIVIAR